MTATSLPCVAMPADPVDCADWIGALFSTSYACVWSEAAFLASMILRGVVEISSTAYTPVPVPSRQNRAAYLRFSDANYGGGYGHSILKWRACHFLKSLGSKAPRYEQEWYHGRADVSCEKLQVAVECGSTDPLKILKCLSAPEAREIWLFPFGEKATFRNQGYRFRRGPSYDPQSMDHLNWSMELSRLNFPEVTNAPL